MARSSDLAMTGMIRYGCTLPGYTLPCTYPAVRSCRVVPLVWKGALPPWEGSRYWSYTGLRPLLLVAGPDWSSTRLPTRLVPVQTSNQG